MKIRTSILVVAVLSLVTVLVLQAGMPNNAKQIQEQMQSHFATYFGGSGTEQCAAIALDDMGNVFVAGSTNSTDFPVTEGTYNAAPKGKRDVCIMKFDKDLKTVIASTILGGSDDEITCSIVYDHQGYIYVAGYTSSKDFPTIPSSYCPTYNGGDGDAFVVKLDTSLKILVASTFLGGSGPEAGWLDPDLALDDHGNLYIVGNSSSQDFPTTKGVVCGKNHNGSRDCFIAKLDGKLEKLLSSTLLGGDDYDRVIAIEIDKRNKAIYVAGWTSSLNFPTTQNAYDKTMNGLDNGFITKLSMDLSTIIASTILDRAVIFSLFIHSNGDIYVGGHAEVGFPTTIKAYHQKFDRHFDQGFISRFSNDLSVLRSSTILPGSFWRGGGGIVCHSLAQNRVGDIIASGVSNPKNFPVTPGAFDETHNGGDEFGQDTYIVIINKELSNIIASTLLGGRKDERWNRMAIDNKGNIYLAGYTSSDNFPISKGSAYGKYNGGEFDGFICKVNENLSSDAWTEFHDAAKKDHLKTIKQLLSSNNGLLDRTDQYERTALHSAARYGAASVCKYLLEQGADIHVKDESGNTALHLAIIHRHDHIMEMLLEKHSDINIRNNDHCSPLALAIMYGSLDAVHMLLLRNADVNGRDCNGNTPLHLAAQFGYGDKLGELLAYHPEINSKNNEGHTPLYLAVQNSYETELIETLIAQGADLSFRDSTGKNLLHIAARAFQSRMHKTKILLGRMSEINAQDHAGNTPLYDLCRYALRRRVIESERLEQLRLFVHASADPYIKNRDGKSAMDLAVESGIQEAVELLKGKK